MWEFLYSIDFFRAEVPFLLALDHQSLHRTSLLPIFETDWLSHIPCVSSLYSVTSSSQHFLKLACFIRPSSGLKPPAFSRAAFS